jgi:hypothetical protein
MFNLQVQAFSPKALKPMLTSAGLLTYSLSFGPSRRLEADSGYRTIRLRNNAEITASGNVPDLHRIPF